MALPIELLVIFLRDFIIFLAIYLVVALSLNLEYGYAGVPNFGKVLAVAGGAFAVACMQRSSPTTFFALFARTNLFSEDVITGLTFA